MMNKKYHSSLHSLVLCGKNRFLVTTQRRKEYNFILLRCAFASLRETFSILGQNTYLSTSFALNTFFNLLSSSLTQYIPFAQFDEVGILITCVFEASCISVK
jgi:hypothetical protein